MRRTPLPPKSVQPDIEQQELKKVGAWWEGILLPVVEYHYLTTKAPMGDCKQNVINDYMKENHLENLQQRYPRHEIALKEHVFSDSLDLFFKLQKIQKNKDNAQQICINLSAVKAEKLASYQKEIFEIVTSTMLKEKTLQAICPNKELANKLSTDFFKFDYA